MFENLKGKRNLLAFSGGTDSSALFNILNKANIDFDLIMVNYNSREQSKDEVFFAKSLVANHNKKLYLLDTKLDLSEGNFEKRARDIRYDFFDEEMIDYDNLILGHNLSDKLEWFLMQLTRGAGIKELYGMERVSSRKDYTIIRPLLDMSKKTILEYLEKEDLKYFYDKSNDNEDFTRNYFRHNFSEKLLEDYEMGIKKTFDILEKEKESLPSSILIYEKKEFLKYEIEFDGASSFLSSLLKRKGYLLSGAQREEFDDKEELTIIFNDISYSASYRDGILSFSPYIKEIIMPKEFKEKMRIKKVHPKHRGYLFSLQNKEI